MQREVVDTTESIAHAFQTNLESQTRVTGDTTGFLLDLADDGPWLFAHNRVKAKPPVLRSVLVHMYSLLA